MKKYIALIILAVILSVAWVGLRRGILSREEPEPIAYDAPPLESSRDVEPAPLSDDAYAMGPFLDGIAKDQEVRAAQVLSAPDLFGRIESFVEILRNETLEESIEKLDEVDHFFWPGQLSDGGRMGPGSAEPGLPPWAGEVDFERIFSNRRFVKIARELSDLPSLDAARIIDAEIEAYLPLYNEMYESAMDQHRGHYLARDLAGAKFLIGIGFVSGNGEEGKTYFWGARYKVLSLMYLTGSLNLTAARETVDLLVSEALAQRDRLYDDDEVHPFFVDQMLEVASLYNRQILSLAVMGTRLSDSQRSALSDSLEMEWKEQEMGRYDAWLSPFDLPVRSGVMLPEIAPGSEPFRFPGPMDDKTFESILRASGYSIR